MSTTMIKGKGISINIHRSRFLVGSSSVYCRHRSFRSSTLHTQYRQLSPRRSFHSSNLPLDVKVVEVGPRDGLQNEPKVPDTQGKLHLIQLLHQSGCRHVEVGSLVSPKWVPSMADTEAVLEGLSQWKHGKEQDQAHDSSSSSSLVVSVLVPNLQGLHQALKYSSTVDEIAIFASASEAFSQKNIACSIDESFQKRFQPVAQEVATANQNNKHPPLLMRGYVSCVIACPYSGKVPPKQVAGVAARLAELGCHEISLGDTIGVGTPNQVLDMLHEVQAAVADSASGSGDGVNLAVHFHDTYGQALTNLLVCLEEGINTIDSSVAGLGGCPYAKGASGNVATEDVVYMLNGLGVGTGIDLDKLVDAAEYISKLLGQPSRSRAGTAIAAKRQC